MIKKCLIALVAIMPCCVFGQSTTPILNLQIPVYGQQNWNVPFAADMNILDTAIGQLQRPFQGTYSSSVAYSKGQEVSIGQNLYISLINSNTGNNPASATNAWALVISGSTSSSTNATTVQNFPWSSTTPLTGQIPEYNGFAWVPSNPSTNATTLQGFPWSNTTPATGQVPVWNGSAWVPGASGGSGGTLVGLPASYFPFANSSTSFNSTSPLDYGATTSGRITSSVEVDAPTVGINGTGSPTATATSAIAFPNGITNLPTPVNTSDAVTKAYVDSSIASVSSSGSSGSSGGTPSTGNTGNLASYNFDTNGTTGLTATGSPVLSTTQFFTGPNSVNFPSGSNYLTAPITTSSTVYERLYLYVGTIGSTSNRILDYYNGSAEEFDLYLTTANVLSWYNQNAATGGTASATPLTTGTWNYIELYWNQNASTGSFAIKINGTQVYAASNVNTGTVGINAIKFGQVATATGWNTYIDNFDVSSSAYLGAVTPGTSGTSGTSGTGGYTALTQTGTTTEILNAANSTAADAVQLVLGSTNTASTNSTNLTIQSGYGSQSADLFDVNNAAGGAVFRVLPGGSQLQISTGTYVFGTLGYDTLATLGACAAIGTSASPSLVACSAAASGAFSCATTASGATCTIADTSVTAASQIFVQLVSDESSHLGVTCNTTVTSPPAIIVASKTASTGFTINLPTFTTNPVCYDYQIIN
jgi:hypothetical protein